MAEGNNFDNINKTLSKLEWDHIINIDSHKLKVITLML